MRDERAPEIVSRDRPPVSSRPAFFAALTMPLFRTLWDAGHDPIKATGLLFTHLGHICGETRTYRAQIWSLVAKNRPGL